MFLLAQSSGETDGHGNGFCKELLGWGSLCPGSQNLSSLPSYLTAGAAPMVVAREGDLGVLLSHWSLGVQDADGHCSYDEPAFGSVRELDES